MHVKDRVPENLPNCKPKPNSQWMALNLGREPSYGGLYRPTGAKHPSFRSLPQLISLLTAFHLSHVYSVYFYFPFSFRTASSLRSICVIILLFYLPLL